MQKFYDFDASSDNFYLEYSQKPMQERIKKEHRHSAWEFYFYLGADMTFFLNDTSYNVKKYDLVFVDRYNYHKTTYKNDEKERILVLLRADFFSMFEDKQPIYDYLLKISKFKVLSFDEKYKQLILEKFLHFAKFYEEHSEDRIKNQIFFADLLATIDNLIDEGCVVEGEKNKNKNSVLVSQITSYINNHYQEKISLDLLADMFFVDKYHMCHIFRKETGVTIVDFINQKRVAEAAILLVDTKKSVNEISAVVGFPNQNYFGVVFKKEYGMSPRTFRTGSLNGQ